MDICEKLMHIQNELKAPKNQFNSFGKYHYRSCEDILEGLKPLLDKYKVILIIADEIVQIGERYYVKSIATLQDTESKDFIHTAAYAREDEKKTGMDLSQLTGSTSSYARKYALNGLFAIDDTKDSDATNDHDKEDKKRPNKKPTDKKEDEDKKALDDNSIATEKQLNYLYKLVKEKNYTDGIKSYIKQAYDKENSTELTKKEASELIEMLNQMG